MKPIWVVCLSFFLLTSCATRYAGQIVRSEECRKIHKNSKKTDPFKLTHVLVDYSYKIDPSAAWIHIQGAIDKRPIKRKYSVSVSFTDPGLMVLEDKRFKDGYLDIFFLGANREVVDSVRSRLIGPSSAYAEPFPMKFKVDHPYVPAYKYIALAYKLEFYGKTQKTTNLKKIYAHKLAVE